MRVTPALVCVALVVAGCASNDDPPVDDDGRIDFERNSEFSGPHIRVFLELDDGREVSVNSDDDTQSTATASTPIPGHQARSWTFVKDIEEGTSVAYALVSWDSANPKDYLMAGWWAEFPGQHFPDLDFAESIQYGIIDGPEIDPAFPPDVPVEGTASYSGQAGGLYTYEPGSDWDDAAGSYIIDEYEGTIELTADFGAATVEGCIGCTGDLFIRRGHFGVFLGDDIRDVRAVARDYELHFGATAIDEGGTFEQDGIEVRHPERAVASQDGFWGGSLSNVPDEDGNPRLIAGFTNANFEEEDGSVGSFFGTFIGLSDDFRGAGEGQ